MSFMTKLDFLSRPVTLKIRGESSAKSVFGAIMSIFFFISAFILLSLLGKELFQRQNPIISTSDIQTEENKIFVKDFPIAFYLLGPRGEDITKQLIDSNLIRATAFTTNSGGHTVRLKDLHFTECSEEITTKYFSTINAIKRIKYCIHPRKSSELGSQKLLEEEIYFSKGFIENESESLVINVMRGENFISDHKTFYFGLITVGNIVDERDYENPVKSSLTTTNKQFDLNSHLKLTPLVQTNRLVTDKGWITAEKEEIVFSSLTVGEVGKPIEGKPEDELIRIEFSSSNIRKDKFREYLKIPTLLANFGGTIKVLQFFCLGIMKIYSEFVVLDYVWSVKREEFKGNMLENKSRDEFKEHLNLGEFLRWKVLFGKPSARLQMVNSCLDVDNILDKQSKTEKTEVSKFKVNISSNHLVKT